jgi:outer membrane protein assembly factor BamA
MRKPPAQFLFLALLTCASCFAQAPTYYPRNIQFKGVPDYTREELLAAAHLKSEDELTVPEMSARGKLLMETGLFSKLTYTFDGINLIFHIVPSPDLLPVKIVNLPLPTGKELDAQLHERLPLYRGVVPGDGGLCEQVRAALEQMLAEQGLKATVQNEALAGVGPDKTPAMNFSIADQAVKVGEIRIDGLDASSLDEKFRKDLEKIKGAAYDTTTTPVQIATVVANYYHGKAYVDAAIQVHALAPATDAEGIQVPFEAVVTSGKTYTLGGIELAPKLLLTQAEFDKAAALKPGDPADFRHVQGSLNHLERQYHNHGLVAAKIHAVPTLDRAKAIVHYHVTVDPGPVYTMGKLVIENVSEDLRTLITSVWSLPAGTAFDESAILRLLAIGDANPTLKKVFAAVECKYTLKLNDENRTVDVLLRLERHH